MYDFSLQVREGEFLTVIGKSGCGKTTMLKLINGLLTPDAGRIFVEGKDLAGADLVALRRRIGYVIQNGGIFPHMTVEKNITYVPVISGRKNKAENRQLALRLLRTVGLEEEMAGRYPSELSGGQQQRVGIARALAAEPRILLMDEPFGALDAQTRAQLQTELLKTWEQEKKTCFFITHDVDEAVLLAQRVVIMSARPGRIKRIVDIDIPYPRDQGTKSDPRFMELKAEIWNEVYQEYLEVRK